MIGFFAIQYYALWNVWNRKITRSTSISVTEMDIKRESNGSNNPHIIHSLKDKFI